MTRGLLAALFAHVPTGLIQVRVLEDKRGGTLVCRASFPDPGQLADDRGNSAAAAPDCTATAIFGVLARQAPGGGTAESALPCLATWAGVDPKDSHGARRSAPRWPRLRTSGRLPFDAEMLKHAILQRPSGQFCHYCHRSSASSRRVPSLGRVEHPVDRRPA